MRTCDLAKIRNLLDALDSDQLPTAMQILKARKAVNREARIHEEQGRQKVRNLGRARARANAE